MVHDVVRNGAQQHAREAAVAARPDHEKIGPVRGPEQDVGRVPLGYFAGDVDAGVRRVPQRLVVGLPGVVAERVAVRGRPAASPMTG